jgi:iron complex transport system permease protein
MIAAFAFLVAVVFDASAASDGLHWPALDDVFFSLRAPRVLLAVLAGVGLSSGGVACQALMRNPLADPYVLGLSGGAALGAVLTQVLFDGAPPWALMLASLAGAYAASYLVMTAQGPRAGPAHADDWPAPPYWRRLQHLRCCRHYAGEDRGLGAKGAGGFVLAHGPARCV